MIQGYAIYLRTHRKTGKQYGGCVWWTKATQTVEAACRNRWTAENRIGIGGLFGGFNSQIILSEKRNTVPNISDGLYRIRIAVDEAKIVEAIPEKLRLNRISPLAQLQLGLIREVTLGLGGRTTHARHPELAKLAGQRNGRKNAENKIGFCGRTSEQMKVDGRKGGLIGGPIAGRNHFQNRTGFFGWSAEQKKEHQIKAGRIAGAKSKQTKTGVHGLTQEQRHAAGQKSLMQRKGVHSRTPQQMTHDGRKGAKIVKEQRLGFLAPGFDKTTGGRIGGKTAVKTGQLAAAREYAKKNQLGIYAPDFYTQRSLKQFLKTVAWG